MATPDPVPDAATATADPNGQTRGRCTGVAVIHGIGEKEKDTNPVQQVAQRVRKEAEDAVRYGAMDGIPELDSAA